MGLCALSCLAFATPSLARVSNASAERTADGKIQLSWTAPGAVDILLAERADAAPASARVISAADKDGGELVAVDTIKRPYFILRDKTDGTMTRVSERLVPLEQGSNFRDIGGYATPAGKHVRWGLIYRSGATAMLTRDDLARVQALGLRNMVDLRSDEERVLAPTKIDGVPYSAVGYSMTTLLATMGKGVPQNGAALYRNFPSMLAPQMRVLFDALKRREGPIEYNCSAGQDRTGFATALILSALGVPRETILKDYQLSTHYRQPKFEMPHIDPAAHANNPVAQMFAQYQDNPAMAKAQPLIEADGTPFLKGALDEIDAKWGSVENYLRQEVGVSAVDIAALRGTYLE